MSEVSEQETKHLKAITDRSAVDAQFRARLMSNPHDAIRDATGVAIPTDVKIKFIERPRGADAVIVLPPPAEHTGDLTADELKILAESGCWVSCWETCRDTCAAYHTCDTSDFCCDGTYALSGIERSQ
jgi:hypothetical protein